jgi:hypothetical protein
MRSGMQRYDAKSDLLLDRTENGQRIIGDISDSAEQQRLIDWMNTRKPANHEPAFTAFS